MGVCLARVELGDGAGWGDGDGSLGVGVEVVFRVGSYHSTATLRRVGTPTLQ